MQTSFSQSFNTKPSKVAARCAQVATLASSWYNWPLLGQADHIRVIASIADLLLASRPNNREFTMSSTFICRDIAELSCGIGARLAHAFDLDPLRDEMEAQMSFGQPLPLATITIAVASSTV